MWRSRTTDSTNRTEMCTLKTLVPFFLSFQIIILTGSMTWWLCCWPGHHHQRFIFTQIYDIYTVNQENGPLRLSGMALSKSTDVGNFWQRQLHFISSSALASSKFNAVEYHLQFPWQRQQMRGLTLNRRLLTKQSTSGENDSGPLWEPKENTLNTCCDWL